MGLDQRADIRLLGKLVGTMGGESDPEFLVKVSDAFVAEGGSWAGIFRGGDPKGLSRLKEILKEKISAAKKAESNSRGARATGIPGNRRS